MSIIGYKRLAFSLAFVCVCLGFALAYRVREYSRVRAVAWESGFLRPNFRYAHDIITSYEMDRDLALKSDVTNAVERLYKLQAPSRPFENPAAQFVERERQRAVRDVIAYLRLKTGQNLGVRERSAPGQIPGRRLCRQAARVTAPKKADSTSSRARCESDIAVTRFRK
jgi:hypothetical protein